MSDLAVVVLAAGKGKRTGLAGAKVLLPLCGATLIECVLDTVDALSPDRVVVVVHHDRDSVVSLIGARPRVVWADQGTPLGTGHAVLAARQALAGFSGRVLILYGDVPLVTREELARLVGAVAGEVAMSLLTAEMADPSGLGRILRDGAGRFRGIREERDCTPEERALREANPGFYCARSGPLFSALSRVGNANAQGEYYLTDVAGILLADGQEVATVGAECPEDLYGVNTLADLARVQAILRRRILARFQGAGVLVEDPQTTTLELGVQIGAGTRIRPGCVLSRGCRVGAHCEVGPLAWLPGDAVVEDGSVVRGPAAWPAGRGR